MHPDLPPIHLWGVTATLSAVTGGHRNRVLRTTGLARDIVFKSSRRDEAALRWLDAVQDCAVQAGFVVARMMPSRNGTYAEAGWTAEPFLDGKPFVPAALPGLTARLKVFHRLTHGIPQRPGFRSATALITVERGGDVDLSQMPAPLVAACRDAWAALPGTPSHAIHGDIATGNVLYGLDSRPALLDWDEARVDAAAFDLVPMQGGDASPPLRRALIAWEIACCWTVEPARARSLAAQLLETTSEFIRCNPPLAIGGAGG